MKLVLLLAAVLAAAPDAPTPDSRSARTSDGSRSSVTSLEAAIAKKGYVTGVEAQSLLDRKTGFRDLGFGLDIVDWIMEPGSDEAYRDQLPGDLPYVFNNLVPRQAGQAVASRGRRSAPGPGSSRRG